MPINASLLQSLPFFASVPVDELRVLAERMQPRRFADGELVLEEGDACEAFYIVVAGQVEIVKALGTPDERRLAVRPAGTVVGELSLFSPGGRHTASVRAVGVLDALSMTRADFDGLLTHQPRLAYGMVQTLSLRLIESEQTTIRDLREKNTALAQALLQLQAAQAQLIEKEKLERELEVARRIQRSLLPLELPPCRGYDFGALMEPMSAVGGDFYDFMVFDDGRIGIAAGDVSDHGVPAALFMTMTVTLLRAAARRQAERGEAAAPQDILRSVNRGLLEFNTQGMFVTVLYGILDPRRGDFHYARAGHEPPLLHVGAPARPAAPPRTPEDSGLWIVDSSQWAGEKETKDEGRTTKGKRGKTDAAAGSRKSDPVMQNTDDAPSPSIPSGRTLDTQYRARPSGREASHGDEIRTTFPLPRGQLLGIVPTPELDVQRLDLPAGATLLLVTDGAREAWDAAGNMFGEAGLRAVLAETAHATAQAICDRIFQLVAAHRGPAPQQDDITVAAVVRAEGG